MSKQFKIPKLTQKEWEDLQLNLQEIKKLVGSITPSSTKDRESIVKIDVLLGLIDVDLHKTYTLKEFNDEMKLVKEKCIFELFNNIDEGFILFCDNVGDYVIKRVNKNTWSYYKDSILLACETISEIRKYTSEHNIPAYFAD